MYLKNNERIQFSFSSFLSGDCISKSPMPVYCIFTILFKFVILKL